MDGLLPIIRRKRRPLLVVDAPPVVVGDLAPVQAVATKPVETVVKKSLTKASDAKADSKLDA